MRMIVWGAGYTGRAVAEAAWRAGWDVAVVSRTPARAGDVAFDSAGAALAGATHMLATAGPGEEGDPVLRRYGGQLGHLAWCGYLSSTGVYGNRDGGWVDEGTAPAPGSGHAERRLRAEEAWRAACAGGGLDLIRLAGIYGPGRSVLDDLRAGRARRIDAPDHAFGRIHREDIVRLVLAAAGRPIAKSEGGVRVLHGNDDLPAPSADVIAEGARLLGVAVPPSVPLEEARAGMSPMARSFWADNRKVSAAGTKQALGLAWLYPTYREGLRAVLEQEVERAGEEQEVGGA